MSEIKTRILEVSLDTIMKHFLDGYKDKNNHIIYDKWYIDPVKGVVIFKLELSPKKDDKKS